MLTPPPPAPGSLRKEMKNSCSRNVSTEMETKPVRWRSDRRPIDHPLRSSSARAAAKAAASLMFDGRPKKIALIADGFNSFQPTVGLQRSVTVKAKHFYDFTVYYRILVLGWKKNILR
jgi:hypothetical protein